MIRKFLKWIAIGLLVIFLTNTIDFLIWRDQTIKSLESNSQLIQTSHGMVEYTAKGDGPPVMVLHGTIGGYDQGQVLGQTLVGANNRCISVSRPGYLRTPLHTGPTFEEQADTYAALLDELGIDKVAIVATSGGGPSALQFALRYPHRCWAMVLIAANSDVNAGKKKEDEPGETRQPPAWLTNILFSDFTSWIFIRVSQIVPDKMLAALVGETHIPAILNNPEKYKTFTEYLNSIAMLSRRREGSLNDGKQFLTFTDYPFDKITCPALILYGTEDQFLPMAEQVYLTKTLPNARWKEIEGGTHFMVISHADILAPLITDFLQNYQ